MALTKKQKQFCEEYVKDLNATQACIRAGYSEKTAAAEGCKLCKKPDVIRYIDELFTIRRMQYDIQEGEILAELKMMAFNNPDIRAQDKLRALELLGKQVGLFSDRRELNLKGNMNITTTTETMTDEELDRALEALEAD